MNAHAMTDLSELIERVRAATGPDRELDAAVLKHFGFHSWIGRMSYHDAPLWIDFGSSEITASIDAAIALAERVLPGRALVVRNSGYAELQHPRNRRFDSFAHGHTPAIAITLATLLALQSQEPS